MKKLTLKFFKGELWETTFTHPILQGEAVSVRGKTAGARVGAGTFQWTSGVQALSLLLVRAIYASVGHDAPRAELRGGRGSQAISLDYAISKQVQWLHEMFGTDSIGQLIARRIFLRTNPNCKMPGPVVVAVNEKFLPSENILIEIDGDTRPSPEKILALAEQIEGLFIPQLVAAEVSASQSLDLLPKVA